MKVAAVSDLHGFLPDIPSADVLLIAGDICPNLSRGEVKDAMRQIEWLQFEFRLWLESLDVGKVIAVAGNHDWCFYCDETKQRARHLGLPWVYLEDSGVIFEGVRFWGSPWQQRFFDWAFNLDEKDLREKWAMIPQDVDVLVTHSPPNMATMPACGDMTAKSEHVGSPSLRQRIEVVRPSLHVFGHIHNGRGHWTYDEMQLANVTVVDERYRLVYQPMIFEVTPKGEAR